MEKIYTNKAPEAIGPYSQAVKVGSLVFTSGQIAIDPADGQVHAVTIEEQEPDESDIETETELESEIGSEAEQP